MAIIIPNLDMVQKANPKLGEAVKKVQDYIRLNVPQAPGNRVPVPFIDSTSVKT